MKPKLPKVVPPAYTPQAPTGAPSPTTSVPNTGFSDAKPALGMSAATTRKRSLIGGAA